MLLFSATALFITFVYCILYIVFLYGPNTSAIYFVSAGLAQPRTPESVKSLRASMLDARVSDVQVTLTFVILVITFVQCGLNLPECDFHPVWNDAS